MIYVHKEKVLDHVQRRYPAAALCHGRRQAEPAGGDEIGARDQAHDRVRAPRALRAGAGVQLGGPCAGSWSIERIGDLLNHNLTDFQGATMSIDENLARSGPEPLARQHHPRHPRRRHAAPLHRQPVGHRPDLQPDDFRRGHRQDAPPTTRAFARRRRPACRAKTCSSSWRWRICAAPPICSGRSSTALRASTAGSRWRSRRCSPTTPRRPSTRPCAFTSRQTAPICTSRFPAPPQACLPSRQAIFAGVPVNVTLLFSREQYLRGGRGVHARHRAAHRRRPRSAASTRSPRCSSAAGTARSPTRCRRNCATGWASPSRSAPTGRTANCSQSKRWRDLEAAGARKQRMLWASTGIKDPNAPPALYVEALAAPDTIDTMPEKTLLAFAETAAVGRHGEGRRRRRAGAGTFCRRRHRRRRARRRSCRSKAPPRSSSPGRSS